MLGMDLSDAHAQQVAYLQKTKRCLSRLERDGEMSFLKRSKKEKGEGIPFNFALHMLCLQ